MSKKRKQPRGLNAYRLKPGRDNPRESAFAAQWKQENEYCDILRSLMRVPCSGDDPKRMCVLDGCPTSRYVKFPIGQPTQRDRIIAATVIQWLGSNVGMSFIIEAFRRCGYAVRYPGPTFAAAQPSSQAGGA